MPLSRRLVSTLPRPARLFAKLDLKRFTRAELDRAFARMDRDGSGTLDRDEVQAFLGPELGAHELWGRRDVDREAFERVVLGLASRTDPRVWPVAFSMLLTGTAVGVIVPVLPLFVTESLSGTSAQFGLVVGAFAVTKMLGNVPSAVLADKWGRKPLLSGGMALVAVGMGAVAFAETMPHLVAARLVTGAGVAAFTTGSTLYLADVSTPLNRARTMAPILAAFSAGTAFGPALGGFMADSIGIKACFGVTGLCFAGLAVYNHAVLSETLEVKSTRHMGSSALDAVRSWKPLLGDERLRSVFLVNTLYWVAMSGAQSTLLPLMLSRDGFTATEVGAVFAVMSTVFVVGSHPAGWLADRFTPPPVMVGSLGIISLGIGLFPMGYGLFPLGLWALGGTILGVSPTAYVTDLAPASSRSQALALLRTTGDVGLLVGAALSGVCADALGFEIAMKANAALLGSGTCYFAYLTWRAKRRPTFS